MQVQLLKPNTSAVIEMGTFHCQKESKDMKKEGKTSTKLLLSTYRCKWLSMAFCGINKYWMIQKWCQQKVKIRTVSSESETHSWVSWKSHFLTGKLKIIHHIAGNTHTHLRSSSSSCTSPKISWVFLKKKWKLRWVFHIVWLTGWVISLLKAVFDEADGVKQL